MEVVTEASLNFETLELLFSLLINHKIYRENKDSSGRSGVLCFHSKDGSGLAVTEFLHPLSCMLI